MSKEPHELVAYGDGDLNSETEDNFDISVEGLADGYLQVESESNG